MIRWTFPGIGGAGVRATGTAAAVALLAPAFPSGCAARGEAGLGGGAIAPAPGRINHVVFFELEDGADAEALIADSLRLGAIPGVTACYAGRHIDTGRETVRHDYDVGFFVAFDSEEAYASYVAHPDHVALVEKWRPRLRALRTYDVLDERGNE